MHVSVTAEPNRCSPSVVKASASQTILAYNIAQGRFPGLRLVQSYKPAVVGPINIAVTKGNAELLEKINTGLANMQKDGRFDAIKKKWGL